MQNNAILQQLGLGEMPCFKSASIPSKKNMSQRRNLGDSESEYEPENYGTDEDDFVDDNQSKKSENTSKKASNKRSDILTVPRSMPGVKRIHAMQSTKRATRSKRLLTLQDVDQSNVMSDPTCVTPTDTPTARTSAATLEQHRQAIVQDDGPHHEDQPNQMATEECSHTTLLDNQMSNAVTLHILTIKFRLTMTAKNKRPDASGELIWERVSRSCPMLGVASCLWLFQKEG